MVGTDATAAIEVGDHCFRLIALHKQQAAVVAEIVTVGATETEPVGLETSVGRREAETGP